MPTTTRAEELKAFDETKSGVKGLVDSGVQNIPNIFYRSFEESNPDSGLPHLEIPVFDLQGINKDAKLRHKVVEGIRNAGETWGFFRIVNHGMSLDMMDEMINGVKRFHEQDDEIKKMYYTRDNSKKVRYNSSFDLHASKGANWRDTLNVNMRRSKPLDPANIPAACRDIAVEYIKHIHTLGDTLYDLLSEALGLKTDFLNQMGGCEHCVLICHYYPACPEPEKTLGTANHTDPCFLAILLQDDIGGLQIHYDGRWIDVPPVRGSLIVNIGDLLQIISNDRLKSTAHRVLAQKVGPRISVASFLTASSHPPRRYAPIKELVSGDRGPIYQDISMQEYADFYLAEGLDGKTGLDYFKL